MLDHERELTKVEREKLLRQVEEGLAHSREIIAQIDNVLAQRSRLLLAQRNPGRGLLDRGPAHRARRFDSGEYPVAISSKLAATCGS